MIAYWTGEDWEFTGPEISRLSYHIGGRVTMSPMELGLNWGATPEQAVAAMREWVDHV